MDTSVALLATRQSDRLSGAIRSALLGGDSFISVISYWEVVLKSMKGKLDVGDLRSWWEMTLEQLNARSLALSPQDVSCVPTLPPIHQDPFDRILIATAISNDLTLLTSDSEVERYAVHKLKVLR